MVKNIKKSVYLIGIGGISMSAIARHLQASGHRVSGSDATRSSILQELEKEGIKICYGHKKTNVTNDYDMVIYSSAIGENNPEFTKAKELKIPLLTRAEALSFISSEYKDVVCVAGSHGKTTTTAMCAHIFYKLNLDFCAHVGGETVNYGTNYVCGKTDERKLLLLEACEYKNNFLSLKPSVAAILNVAHDHVDCFKSEQDVVDSFIKFSNNVKENGTLVLNKDDKFFDDILRNTNKNKKILSVSLKNCSADCYFKTIVKVNGGYNAEVIIKGKSYSFFAGIKGEHNLYNLIFSLAIVFSLGKKITSNIIEQIINSFCGVKRRFESVGQINGAKVIFDYAHHPDEIAKVIKLAQEDLNGKLFVVFQPHTYTRTKAFWSGFIRSLRMADKLILYPIYSAREKQIVGVTSARLAKELRGLGASAYYAENLDCVYNYLGYFVKAEDCVMVLGAGDIDNLRKYFK